MSAGSVRYVLMAGAALALLAACQSSTQLNAQWLNPNAGKAIPVKSIVVMGVANDTTGRRIYEDTMVAALTARGVKAVPSYPRLPADGPAPQAVVEKVVKEAGAEAILISRLVNVTNETVVSPGFYGPPIGWGGFYGVYSGFWGSAWAVPPSVYTYQNYSVDTRLFDVKEVAVQWSGSTTTTPTGGNMQSTLSEFVKVIIDAMAKSGVI